MLFPEHYPSDIISPILEHLDDRRHLFASALVSRTFNHAATPFLYRTLDSRIISKAGIFGFI
jgi:hypothetical protein